MPSLAVPAISSTSECNEMLTVSTLMHKLRAAQGGGKSTIQLSELLGVAACSASGLQRFTDVQLLVPQCFCVESLSQRKTRDNFAGWAADIQANAQSKPSSTCIAFINGAQAPFSDGFVLFRRADLAAANFTLHVQEKQSVQARRQSSRGLTIPSLDEAAVTSEYNKVLPRDDAVLLFVTDKLASARLPLPPHTIVIGHCELPCLLGSVVAQLRAFSFASDPARETGARVHSGGTAAGRPRTQSDAALHVEPLPALPAVLPARRGVSGRMRSQSVVLQT